MKEDSYIGGGPSILAMACLDTDQIVVLSAWVVVFQQSHLPLIVQHKTWWFIYKNVLAGGMNMNSLVSKQNIHHSKKRTFMA